MKGSVSRGAKKLFEGFVNSTMPLPHKRRTVLSWVLVLCPFLMIVVGAVIIVRLDIMTPYEAIQVGVTATLVILTGLYAQEARKSRLEAVRPALSIRLEGKDEWHNVFVYMYFRLHNGGGTARNLKMDIKTKEPYHTKRLFLADIDRGETVTVPLEGFRDVQRNKGFVILDVLYDDTYGLGHYETLKIDFGALAAEGRELILGEGVKRFMVG